MAHNKNVHYFEVWSVDFPDTLNIYFYITQAYTKKRACYKFLFERSSPNFAAAKTVKCHKN